MLAVLPLFSPSQNNKLIPSAPFATVALAGHTVAGTWCECGTLGGCFCDPGENPGGNSATPVSDNQSSDQGRSPIRARSHSGSDLGTGTLILALALFLWARLRA
jgi:hypothetical protein